MQATPAKQTHGTFEDVLALAEASLQPICVALRALVAAQDPGFFEVAWPKLKIASYGVGPAKQSQHYAYIAVHRAHLNLGFYHGADLADPQGLLEGSGKQLRHVKIRTREDVRHPALAALLLQAVHERAPYR